MSNNFGSEFFVRRTLLHEISGGKRPKHPLFGCFWVKNPQPFSSHSSKAPYRPLHFGSYWGAIAHSSARPCPLLLQLSWLLYCRYFMRYVPKRGSKWATNSCFSWVFVKIKKIAQNGHVQRAGARRKIKKITIQQMIVVHPCLWSNGHYLEYSWMFVRHVVTAPNPRRKPFLIIFLYGKVSV